MPQRVEAGPTDAYGLHEGQVRWLMRLLSLAGVYTTPVESRKTWGLRSAPAGVIATFATDRIGVF